MSSMLHPIKVVVQRTGLSAHVIRVWERRYQVVTPQRTATNRRAYTDEDIERLSLLRLLTAHGQPIGYLAGLTAEQLQRLGSELTANPPATPAAATAEGLVAQGIEAVKRLDARALETTLNLAETEFGIQGMLQRVIGPLAERLGDLWRDGTVTAAHEHFASAVLRTELGQAVRPYSGSETAPVIVVATPGGQLHELGALIAGAMASNLGWRVIYLGASLPAAEIAGTARQHRAKLVALSLVYPLDDPRLDSELARLRELLPGDVPIVVGGRAASAYRSALEHIGAHVIGDLTTFGKLLDGVRPPATPENRHPPRPRASIG